MLPWSAGGGEVPQGTDGRTRVDGGRVALPAELVSANEQTRDSVYLDQWINIAATIATLDEFRRDCGV